MFGDTLERATPGDHHDRVAAAQGLGKKIGDRAMQKPLVLIELNGVHARGFG